MSGRCLFFLVFLGEREVGKIDRRCFVRDQSGGYIWTT